MSTPVKRTPVKSTPVKTAPNALPAWPFPTGNNVATAGINKPHLVVNTGKVERARWDVKSLSRFATMLASGETAETIAAQLQRTVKAVTNQISDMKLKKTVTGRQLATFLSNAQAQIAKAAKPANHKATWDAKADRQLLIAFGQIKSVEEIAEICGRTPASVAGRLRELGVLEFKREANAETGEFNLSWSIPAVVWYSTTVKA